MIREWVERDPCLFLKWKSLVLVLTRPTRYDNLINDGNTRLLLTLLESCNVQTSVGYVCRFHLFSLPRYLASNKSEDCVGSEKVPKSLAHLKSNWNEELNFFLVSNTFRSPSLCHHANSSPHFIKKIIYLHKCIFGRYTRGSRVKRPCKF